MKRYEPFFEVDIPLKPGDIILHGKFKNKKATVSSFSKDDKGQPVIITDTGKKIPLLKIRIAKLMEK